MFPVLFANILFRTFCSPRKIHACVCEAKLSWSCFGGTRLPLPHAWPGGRSYEVTDSSVVCFHRTGRWGRGVASGPLAWWLGAPWPQEGSWALDLGFHLVEQIQWDARTPSADAPVVSIVLPRPPHPNLWSPPQKLVWWLAGTYPLAFGEE